VLCFDGSDNKAEQEERTAIKISVAPEARNTFRINLARILLRLDRTGEAADELDNLDASHKDDAIVQNLLGLIQERQGNTKDAEANYRKAIAICDTAQFRSDLARLLCKNRQFNEAAEQAYQACAIALPRREQAPDHPVCCRPARQGWRPGLLGLPRSMADGTISHSLLPPSGPESALVHPGAGEPPPEAF